MTQPGETDNYSVSDHLTALMKHANSRNILDAVLVNDFIPSNLADKYKLAGSYPVKVDVENIKKLGIKIFPKKLIEDSREGLVRHSSNRVARAIYYWYKKEHKSEKIHSFLTKNWLLKVNYVKKITVNSIQKYKNNNEKFSVLTAYDYSTAKYLDEAGIDIILIGDSLAW